MLMGIDSGLTGINGVVIDDGHIISFNKTPRHPQDFLGDLHHLCSCLLAGISPRQITNVCLTSTTSTNAVLHGNIEEVGIITTSGPDIGINHLCFKKSLHTLDGAIDCYGQEKVPLKLHQLRDAIKELSDTRVFAVAGRFALRNPSHEQAIAAAINYQADFVSMSHWLNEVASYPRRLAAAYFNSAVWRKSQEFTLSARRAIHDMGITAPIQIVRSDGTTIPFNIAAAYPVCSILSGAAAELMGLMAVTDETKDCLVISVGGGATHIGAMKDGSPVFDSRGLVVGSYLTLPSAFKMSAFAMGGNSILRPGMMDLLVGPETAEKPLCLKYINGPPLPQPVRLEPTLTDALNVLGLADVGNASSSRQGLAFLGRDLGLSPTQTAQAALDKLLHTIREAAINITMDIMQKPIRSLANIDADYIPFEPCRVWLLGGAAPALAEPLAQALGMEVKVPQYHDFVAAIGAALLKPTNYLELTAETATGVLNISNSKSIGAITTDYDLTQAKAQAMHSLLERLGGESDGAQHQLEVTQALEHKIHPQSPERKIKVFCRTRPSLHAKLKG